MKHIDTFATILSETLFRRVITKKSYLSGFSFMNIHDS